MKPVLLRILYWLAVLVVSLALLVALVLFFESRDPTSVDGSGGVLLLVHRSLRGRCVCLRAGL